jgi:galactose oxidase
MYDAGKILKTGGSTRYEFADGSNSAYTIATTQGTSVGKLAPMAYRRTFANGVALPDGKVMIVGGVSYAEQGTDGNSVLIPEIWNPATGLFSTMAAQSVPRNYHGILLRPTGASCRRVAFVADAPPTISTTRFPAPRSILLAIR